MNSALSIEEALAKLSPVLLRDLCSCHECKHPGNGQRLLLAENLNLNVKVQAFSMSDSFVDLTFTDGHRSFINSEIILLHAKGSNPQSDRSSETKMLWRRSDISFPEITWEHFQSFQKLEALRRVKNYGFTIITEVPRIENAVLDVIAQFGYVRETNYGKVFDVRVEHNPNNLAFTDLEIPPHTDNPYRNPVPTIQLLHCLESEVDGGESGLVDGFYAANVLKKNNPEAFQILSETIFEFRYQSEQTYLSHCGPILNKNRNDEIDGIRWNDRSMQSYAGNQDSTSIYSALSYFSKIVNSAELSYKFKLKPGDCVIFDNSRILHSRTSFDGAGKRHLQGAYSDLDSLFSLIKILEAQVL